MAASGRVRRARLREKVDASSLNWSAFRAHFAQQTPPSAPDQPPPPWPLRLLKFCLKPHHLPLGMFGIGLQVGDTGALAVGLFTP
jgi:hypothetical protein